ncbi:MAG: YraN family protein [Chloroflexota bacterium]|nr:YraN family protein [Chloroflexota bacterium]
MAKTTTHQRKIGNLGENIAATHLEKKGYQILDRNYSSRYGELDLVAKKGSYLVFVEVKTRTSNAFGMPEASVTADKFERICNTGLFWLQDHPEEPDDWRVDVIAIQLDQNHHIRDIHHFENILL